MTGYKLLLFCLLSVCMVTGHAETRYVIDELQVGLHKENTTDSPIVKLVPSGTELDVLERSNETVRVREPGGETGWVHQRYLIDTPPDNTRLLELQKRNAALENELQQIKSGVKTATDASDSELEQQLNSERLKVGELQAQLADFRARLGNISNSEDMMEELERLREANSELASQLALAGVEQPAAKINVLLDPKNWKFIALALGSLFILGMAAGAFLLDYMNRRRHGGFRV